MEDVDVDLERELAFYNQVGRVVGVFWGGVVLGVVLDVV